LLNDSVAEILQRRWWMKKWLWSIIGMIMTKENRNTGENMYQCHIFHHKSYTDWPGIESGLPRWGTHDWPMTSQEEVLKEEMRRMNIKKNEGGESEEWDKNWNDSKKSKPITTTKNGIRIKYWRTSRERIQWE